LGEANKGWGDGGMGRWEAGEAGEAGGEENLP